MLDEAMNEHGRDRPTSLSLVLSMPGGSTDHETLQDAAQAFARILFEDNHAYMLALHTDTDHPHVHRSEEHTSELQSLMRNSYAVFCLKNKTNNKYTK